MRLTSCFAAVALLALLALAALDARADEWERLGSRVVAFAAERDVIDCRGEGRFTALMFEVEDGDVEMFDFVVTFGNGERVSPPTRLVFDGDNRTRVIDLPGRDKAIRRIDFFYKSIRVTRDGRATIHLYGRR
jgi:hypothetical protein